MAQGSGKEGAAEKKAPQAPPPDNQGERRAAWLALEYPAMGDFDDPALEWRRLFSEILGTFLLVLVAAGAGLLHISNGDQVSLAAAVVAPGLMVMAVILFMGAVSGAHLNPGVSIAFALRRDFPWRRVPGYVLAQLFGAVLAALFLYAVFGDAGNLGTTTPGSGFVAWQAFLIELVLTFGLVSVILGTSSGAQNVGQLGALAVGGYIALAGLWGAPVSGASMNTARSFGPALVSGDFTAFWVYVAGPLSGMLLAVGCAFILRGAGGSQVSLLAGSGRLGQERRRERREERARKQEARQEDEEEEARREGLPPPP